MKEEKRFSVGSGSAYSIAMVFERSKTLPGLIYVPQRLLGRSQKYDCRDCFSCQLCGEERCKLCRIGKVKFTGKPVCPKGEDQ